jgi:hypothetical protein
MKAGHLYDQAAATQHRALILIGIYTGTRASATASPYPQQGHSFVDLERGIFYRKQIGKRGTKKRQTPAPVPASAAGPHAPQARRSGRI